MGHDSIKNLSKIISNNPNVDLVNINVYTNFGLILSIRSQDIEQKSNKEGMSVGMTE